MKIRLIDAHILWSFCPPVCRSGYKRQKCKIKETWFFRRIYKIEVWFFFCDYSSYWCASILRIFYPSVCLSGFKRQKCKNKETWFSQRLYKIEVWFLFLWRFVRQSVLNVMYFIVVERFRDFIFFHTFFFNFLFIFS